MNAFENYTKGRTTSLHNLKNNEKIEYFNKAIKYDQEFASAHIALSDAFLNSGDDQKMIESLKKAMSLLYKLPELLQYQLKSEYFRFVEKNPEKLIKLNQLCVILQPHNIHAHKMLFNELEISNRVDEALEVGLAIIDMDPSDFNNLEDVISLYKQNKDYFHIQIELKVYAI